MALKQCGHLFSENSFKGGPDPYSQPDITSYGGAVDDMEFCQSFAKLSFKQAAALESLNETLATNNLLKSWPLPKERKGSQPVDSGSRRRKKNMTAMHFLSKCQDVRTPTWEPQKMIIASGAVSCNLSANICLVA